MSFLLDPTTNDEIMNIWEQNYDIYVSILLKGEGRFTDTEEEISFVDSSYCNILTQSFTHKIDISKVKKTLFEIDYSDFFQIDKNFEFYYEGNADGY